MNWKNRLDNQQRFEKAFDSYVDPETGWSLTDIDRLERLRDFLTNVQNSPKPLNRVALSTSPSPKGNGKYVEHVAYVGDTYKNDTLNLCTIQGAEHISHAVRATKDEIASSTAICADLRNPVHDQQVQKSVNLLQKLAGPEGLKIKYLPGNVWIEVGNEHVNQPSNAVVIPRLALEALVKKIDSILEWRDEARQAQRTATTEQEPADYREQAFDLLRKSTINTAFKAREEALVGINVDDLDGLAFLERVKGIGSQRTPA